MINWLFNLFKKAPTRKLGYGVISYKEIQKLIPNCKKDKIYISNPDLTISDKHYLLPKKSQIKNFLVKDNTSIYRYGQFDCDDFAIILFGRLREHFPNFAIGFCASDEHAFNFFIDDNKKLWKIEPQTDRIFTSNITKYKIKMALI